MTDLPLEIPMEALGAFCARWRVTELSLFGSVLRDDFGPESDIDVLVTFEDGAPWSYWDWPTMQSELKALLGGRDIDLVEEAALKNPFRRASILGSKRVLYHAA